MIKALVIAIAATAGCSFRPGSFSEQTPLDAADAHVDAVPDVAVDSLSCWGAGTTQVCFAIPPSGTVTLDPQSINTGTSNLCATNVIGASAASWCVIAADVLTVNAGTLAVTGSRPLVLLGATSLHIDGTIDVAGHIGGKSGPGSEGAACNAGTLPSGVGGGAGGSNGATGGDGSQTNHGTAGAQIADVTLHGGCRGQTGSGPLPGAGGSGGGGVALISGMAIVGDGTIDASGAGGGGGAPMSGPSGAGGGGSGGMIVLDAPSIQLGGIIFANGGGGGEGSGSSTGVGNPGSDPTGVAAASGGSTGSSSGGDGGAGGAAGSLMGGAGGTATNGGGGGGGSAGVIRVLGTLTGNPMISPAPT